LDRTTILIEGDNQYAKSFMKVLYVMFLEDEQRSWMAYIDVHYINVLNY